MKFNPSIEKLVSNRRRLFWLFQFLFWFVHWFTHLTINPRNTESFSNFAFFSLRISIMVSLTLILRQVYKRYRWSEYHIIYLVFLILLNSTLCGLLFAIIARFTFYAQLGFQFFPLAEGYSEIVQVLFFETYPFVAWSALYIGYKIWEEWNKQRLQSEQEQALLQRARLELLRYQLNPHFLFNTLSSLRGSLRVNVDQAEEMITQMSEFLRYSLLGGKNSEVPLSKELENVRHYLNIEKVRFGSKMSVEYDIDPLAEDYPVPIFLIQPLIENALKHGMKSSPLPLRILVRAEVVNDALSLEIRNTGQWIESSPGAASGNTGTGLANTVKRLEHYFPKHHSFEIRKENGMVSVCITIHRDLQHADG